MKKIFCLLLSILMISSCLLLGGCNSEFAHICAIITNQPCEYHDYPFLYNKETGGIVYNGNVYYQQDIYWKGFVLKEDEERVIVGKEIHLYGMCMPIYKSVNDIDANILFPKGSYMPYIKEGVTFPDDVLDCEYSKIVLKSANNKKVVVESENFVFPITIDELIKAEDKNVGYAWEYGVADIEFDIVGYPYLTSIFTDIYIYDNIIYFCDWDGDDSRFYPIKDEYQEVFRNAINELNNA